MKQRDIVKKLEEAGFIFERHGSNHDIYVRGKEKEEVPRHKEIDERLAKAIIKRYACAPTISTISARY